ncbi:MAG: hypothetical protein PHH50_01045 [Candidatus Pacebacteria bacterium]|nr:hypothetical protein [Candidatus Paceibacterota bacterium]
MKHLFFIYWARAKEKWVVDSTDFSRMINALTLKEAFKVLQDTDYAPYALSKDSSNYEDVIKEEKEEFKKILLKMGAKDEILNLLSLNQENVFETAKKIKSKKVSAFLKSYGQLLKEFEETAKKNDMELLKEKEDLLEEKEEEFVLASEMQTEGLSPFFAFLLKKRKAEKIVSLILSSKKLGILPLQINELIKNVRMI